MSDAQEPVPAGLFREYSQPGLGTSFETERGSFYADHAATFGKPSLAPFTRNENDA